MPIIPGGAGGCLLTSASAGQNGPEALPRAAVFPAITWRTRRPKRPSQESSGQASGQIAKIKRPAGSIHLTEFQKHTHCRRKQKQPDQNSGPLMNDRQKGEGGVGAEVLKPVVGSEIFDGPQNCRVAWREAPNNDSTDTNTPERPQNQPWPTFVVQEQSPFSVREHLASNRAGQRLRVPSRAPCAQGVDRRSMLPGGLRRWPPLEGNLLILVERGPGRKPDSARLARSGSLSRLCSFRAAKLDPAGRLHEVASYHVADRRVSIFSAAAAPRC